MNPVRCKPPTNDLCASFLPPANKLAKGKLVAEGNFWRNPGDPRDFSTQQPTGPIDNFVLKFQKPQ